MLFQRVAKTLPLKNPLCHVKKKSNMMKQPGWDEDRRVRFHGDHGPPVIALHGGPGAFGGAVRLALGLSREFRVIEPWQRPSGDMPLTVAVHVEDLHNLILSRFNSERPALVGSSWGAMLALAYAAEHSDSINAIVLVGCGTFDKTSRDVIVRRRKQKIIDHISKHPEHEADLRLDIGEQMMKWHRMTDAYETFADSNELPESEPFDMQGHTETWQDMVRCQEAGVYPQSFVSVRVPAIMLHGADDPHPGGKTRDTLSQYPLFSRRFGRFVPYALRKKPVMPVLPQYGLKTIRMIEARLNDLLSLAVGLRSEARAMCEVKQQTAGGVDGKGI